MILSFSPHTLADIRQIWYVAIISAEIERSNLSMHG